MRKIRNFLYFFICSFHLNYPTTEEQITDRQVLLGVPQKDANRNRRSPSCDRTTPANTHPYLQANLLASIMGENPIGKTNKLGEQHFSSTERSFFSSFPFLKDLLFIFLIFTTCGKFRFSISPFCRIFADSYRMVNSWVNTFPKHSPFRLRGEP